MPTAYSLMRWVPIDIMERAKPTGLAAYSNGPNVPLDIFATFIR